LFIGAKQLNGSTLRFVKSFYKTGCFYCCNLNAMIWSLLFTAIFYDVFRRDPVAFPGSHNYFPISITVDLIVLLPTNSPVKHK
jgi:hypothetical protein